MADREADHGAQPTESSGRHDPVDGSPRPQDIPAPARSNTRWPASAVCAVAVTSVAAGLLLLMNLLGVRLGRGAYDATTGGSMADWFEAFATLVTVPVAVLVGVRQLRSTSEELDLVRRRLAAEEAETAERLRTEQALLRDAVRARTCAANVVDHTDLATAAERSAVERWRDECRIRGWVPDAEARTWSRDSLHRSNAELLALESSPLVRRPWFGAIECSNHGAVTVSLQRWTVVHDGTSSTTEASVELRPGAVVSRRVGADAGLQPAYAKPADVEARLATVTVLVDGCDAADRPFQIVAHRD